MVLCVCVWWNSGVRHADRHTRLHDEEGAEEAAEARSAGGAEGPAGEDPDWAGTGAGTERSVVSPCPIVSCLRLVGQVRRRPAAVVCD